MERFVVQITVFVCKLGRPFNYFKKDHCLINLVTKKWTIPRFFFLSFCLFKQTLQFLQQIYVKIVHSVYGAGIQTRDLQIMSLLP